MIGMGAILLNGVRVGTGSVIGAGAVLAEGTQVPPGSLVLGMPGGRAHGGRGDAGADRPRLAALRRPGEAARGRRVPDPTADADRLSPPPLAGCCAGHFPAFQTGQLGSGQ